MLAVLHGKLSVYEYETDALRLLAGLDVVFIGLKHLLIKHDHIRKVAFFQRAALFHAEPLRRNTGDLTDGILQPRLPERLDILDETAICIWMRQDFRNRLPYTEGTTLLLPPRSRVISLKDLPASDASFAQVTYIILSHSALRTGLTMYHLPLMIYSWNSSR